MLTGECHTDEVHVHHATQNTRIKGMEEIVLVDRLDARIRDDNVKPPQLLSECRYGGGEARLVGDVGLKARTTSDPSSSARLVEPLRLKVDRTDYCSL